MITKNIPITFALAQEWYTSGNPTLKSLALKAFTEEELNSTTTNRVKSFEELQNIDVVYASNCVRTLQTAKYLLKAQNLKITLDERLDERRFGEPNSDEFPDWFERQYLDENFKTVGGESQKDVRERMNEAITEILKENAGKRIAVFSHGYAITFYLMQWYKLLNVDSEQKLTFEYKGKIVYDRKINAPEVFKLTIGDNNEVQNIEVIDIDYSEVE